MGSRNNRARPVGVNRRQPSRNTKGFVKKRKIKKSYFDYSLLFIILFMLAFGLLMLYSTSSYNASIQFNSSVYYLRKQLIATAIGLVVMFIIANIDYHRFVKWSLPAYIISIVLVLLVMTPLGYSANGARRWLGVNGFSIQPAEVVKIALIMFMAVMLNNNRSKLKYKSVALKMFFICVPPAAAILIITRNMSSALIVVAIAFIMLFVASPKYSHYVIVFVAGIAAIFLYLMKGSGFRSERFAAWQNPELYASGTGYQTLQSLYAIGSGGLTGKGLGQSVQKLGYVPEAQNDMVFSIICEELGLFGGIAVILLFLLMIWRFFVVANNAEDLYGSLLVIGVMAHISVQVILNIAVVTNTLPNTGITLPFISYGGTSILFLLSEMGLVLSVSKRIKME